MAIQVLDYAAAGGCPDLEDAPRVTDYPEKVRLLVPCFRWRGVGRSCSLLSPLVEAVLLIWHTLD
jgi:hypothetical protein